MRTPLCTALVFVLAASYCSPAFPGQVLTITGIVSGFSLYADDGAVYDMADTDTAARLADMQKVKVRVTGTLKDDPVLGRVLDVSSFTVLTQRESGPPKDAEDEGRAAPSQEIQPQETPEPANQQ